MLIASLTFNVVPDKRGEFVSGVSNVVDALRALQGCLGCRLVSDCENENVFVLISEWDQREFLDRHLASIEFQILQGTHVLLSDRPVLSVDEVVARRRAPRPRRHVEAFL